MEPYWDQNGHAPHPIKYESEAAVSGFPYCTESSLNFSTSGTTYSEDDTEYAPGRRNKTSRQDPLSHRIIEKRRRDRMNSCLADLSRLIPPQYQRKGRGRIEKTEIIEMAIRHLKHLQNECVHKDIEYKLGYSDCMKEAAKFLYESHMQDCCYRLIAHLQEHCDEVIKGECFKNRCNVETISASSGSPAQNTNYHNASVPSLSQLRDMLTSDVEHSNDNNDIKDLSFRNHNQSHQAPVITTTTTTAPSSICHDSSNHDFDSSRDISHHENELLSSPPPLQHHMQHHINSLVSQHNNSNTSVSIASNHHLILNGTLGSVGGGGSVVGNNGGSNSSIGGGITLKQIRMRNFSESSHDIENNNNNYKYKNHIKERFNHDVHLNDESTSDHSIPSTNITERTSPIINDKSINKTLDNNEIALKKRKLDSNKDENITDTTANNNNNSKTKNNTSNNDNNNINKNNNNIKNTINEIKIEPPSQINVNSIKNPNINNANNGRHFPVPIFALHGQGTYYVPLNIDYDTLLPYLNGIDLLDKNFCPLQMLHPVNINVNFTIPTSSSQSFVGITRPIGLPTAAILPRSKIEKLSNGW